MGALVGRASETLREGSRWINAFGRSLRVTAWDRSHGCEWRHPGEAQIKGGRSRTEPRMLVTHGCVEDTAKEAGQVGQCGAERTREECSREDGEVDIKGHLEVRQA